MNRMLGLDGGVAASAEAPAGSCPALPARLSRLCDPADRWEAEEAVDEWLAALLARGDSPEAQAALDAMPDLGPRGAALCEDALDQATQAGHDQGRPKPAQQDRGHEEDADERPAFAVDRNQDGFQDVVHGHLVKRRHRMQQFGCSIKRMLGCCVRCTRLERAPSAVAGLCLTA